MNSKDNNGHAFPLALAGPGERLKIVSLKAGKGLNRRLSDLGLPLGSDIRIVQRQHSGAMVVSHDNTRIALGAGMVHKIMVALAGPAADGEAAADIADVRP